MSLSFHIGVVSACQLGPGRYSRSSPLGLVETWTLVRYPGVAEARDQGCHRECLDISNAGDTQASLRSFQGVFEVNTIFIIPLRLFSFSTHSFTSEQSGVSEVI